MMLTLKPDLKMLILLIILSFFLAYGSYFLTNGKTILPGDFYKVSGSRKIYIPLATTLITSVLLYFILTTKLLYYLITVVSFYFLYRVIFKRKI